MCGIIGYTGNKEVKSILLKSLSMLEYRGYDSAGIAICDSDTNHTQIFKCAGRVNDLEKVCENKNDLSTCGIGHTRWATHGGVCDKNAHPHRQGSVTVVHNGIIENYKELIHQYHFRGELCSETDSEVVASLLNLLYSQNGKKAREAITSLVEELKGTFALVIMFEEEPGVIYSVRNVSPIVATTCDEGSMLASDVTALCQFTNRYFVVPEYHILEMHKDGLHLFDMEGNEATPEYLIMDWEKNCADKNSFPFYMEKEIMEQPDVIEKTISSRIQDGAVDFSNDQVPDSIFVDCHRICVVACGTAMHAGLVFQALVKSILQMHIEVELASEFMYSDPVIDKNTLLIAVSQSGETIDTLEALKYAKKKGAKSLSIINVKGSSIARESDYVLYTDAGPEIAVASTKAYTTQLAMFYLIIAKMAKLKGKYSDEECREFLQALADVPISVKDLLNMRKEIHIIAREVLEAKDLFMIGRGLDFSLLLEGSLKLKEVSYIHSEAYASGELKHGPIALITQNTPVIAVVTQKKLVQKEISNIREVNSRGARVVIFFKDELSDKLEI